MPSKKTKNPRQNRVNKFLEIPQEVTSNIPKMTIIGFEKMLIENYKAILEYQEFYIRISTYVGIININGFELHLEEMTTDDLLINGKIEEIEFETITDWEFGIWIFEVRSKKV